MDRRSVAFGLGILLMIEARAPAQAPRPAPDPSAQGPVGLAPLRSLDTLNGIPGMAGTTPSSAITAPPASPLPTPPINSTPVGIPTLSPIRDSVNTDNAGLLFPRIGVSSWFRKDRGRPAATTHAEFPRGVPPRRTPARVDSATVPAYSAEPDAPTAIGKPSGRPAPYANQAPESPRRQAVAPVDDGSTAPAAGRPAPLANDQPRRPRPRATIPEGQPARGPRPTSSVPARPASSPARPPLDAAPEVPVVVPTPPPPIEPVGPTPLPVPEPATSRPTLEPTPAPVVVPPFEPSPATNPPPPADPAVKPASGESTSARIAPESIKELPYATRRAATVGDEIITLHDVEVIVADEFRSASQGQPLTPAEKRQLLNQLGAQALAQLIDRSLILQEAKRRMKNNSKALKQFDDFVDKKWHDEMLPPLLRGTASANEYELKKKLAEEGKSYAEMKKAYRDNMMAHEFLMNMLRPKVNSDLIELRAYYQDHLKDFDQPARISWREIEVDYAKSPDPAAAHKKAEGLAARLARGDDFATVARESSDGPTANQGGLYADMTPGGYGIPSVNDALNRLPIGQVSPIIEAPASLHIVRVESRRDAGPLRFDEVQDNIREIVFVQTITKARQEYLAKLRSKTLIRTMFDNTDSDPARFRAADPNVRQASGR